MKKAFGTLQQVGKALMTPVAILPAAGILLALGALLQNPYFIDLIPGIGSSGVQGFANVMQSTGDIIFGNLPLLFAVGVAIGLAEGEGVAGLAAIVGFLIMNVTMSKIIGITPDHVNGTTYASVLGIPTLQTGVFGGIIAGILASSLYKKFHAIELPSYLGFFAGKRFVPIITAACALIVGAVLVVVWPYVQTALNAFSTNVIDQNRTLAAFIFGVVERSLIPFGLHHIFYSPIWFEFGNYVNNAGVAIHGDNKIWFAQLKDQVPFTAGTFMTGKFPFMMFGLPAAAYAMYQEARPEKKKLVGGILASAALTSFLTGITEPIEFSFLFVAPVLYGIHAVLAGCSFMLMHILGVKIGMTFSGGVIDFILFGVIPNRTPWYWVIIVGLGFAVIYYFLFKFAIRKWNLMTPGREEDDDEEEMNVHINLHGTELAGQILEAMGGSSNITNLDACITRLRVSVKDIKNVDKSKLKSLGAAGVLEVGNNIQAIFGPKSDTLKSQIKSIMSGKAPAANKAETVKDEKKKIVKGETISSPIEGTIVDLSQVPDQVFSQKMVGDGFAIIPAGNEIVSPVDGVITTIFPTKHAIGITSKSNLELLIHIGVDTVSLNGEGFEAFVKAGDEVKVGTKLLKVDFAGIKGKVPSITSPVVFTNLEENQYVDFVANKKVKAGQEIATIRNK